MSQCDAAAAAAAPTKYRRHVHSEKRRLLRSPQREVFVILESHNCFVLECVAKKKVCSGKLER